MNNSHLEHITRRKSTKPVGVQVIVVIIIRLSHYKVSVVSFFHSCLCLNNYYYNFFMRGPDWPFTSFVTHYS